MATQADAIPRGVIEAARSRLRSRQSEYRMRSEQAANWQELAQAEFDAATAAREDAEKIEAWLDMNVLDWREPEDRDGTVLVPEGG